MKEYISASYCQLTVFCTFCFLLFSFLYEANLHIIFCNKLHLWKVVVTLLCFCQKRPTRLFLLPSKTKGDASRCNNTTTVTPHMSRRKIWIKFDTHQRFIPHIKHSGKYCKVASRSTSGLVIPHVTN